ncbi:MAG: MBL fold metallo-hydrolase [Clostridiales bacterium]|jgi:phosphoribosyl 1,2-cyclic phosphodiesterase|nr:MBL fold metallo-hydrolase [Clostridiales bacterium]
MRFCALSSGSSGNSAFLEHKNVRVLIDCGRSGKHIEAALREIGENAEDLRGILVTHEHIDHIRGVGVLARRFNLPVYATCGTWEAMARSGQIGEIPERNVRRFNCGDEVDFGAFCAKSFRTPHDAAQPVGYRFELGAKSVVVATDIGHVSAEVEENIYGADVALLESNHDIDMLEQGEYPPYLKLRILGENGHLSNRAAAGIAAKMVKSGTSHLILGHLSEKNNTPELARREVFEAMDKIKAKVGQDVKIGVASRHCVSELIAL